MEIQNLQRGYSDSQAFVPRHPSNLGPGRKGTVSMPTSPLMSHRLVDHHQSNTHNFWQPQSAQGVFDIPAQKWYPQMQQSHHAIGPSVHDPFGPGQPNSESSPEHMTNGNAEGRRKRAQVKNACTNCQKACKKCSDVRPCERCVKYGLKDCMSSTRRPRKSGIKRGPYKQHKTSKSYPHHHAPDPRSHLLKGYGHLPQRPVTDQHDHFSCQAAPQATRQQSSKLHGALHNALAGPRWVNGRRTFSNEHEEFGKLEPVLYPPTPTVPFPISLNRPDVDPFSRAVSPIHSNLASTLSGLKPLAEEQQHQPLQSPITMDFGTKIQQQQQQVDTPDSIVFSDPFAQLQPSSSQTFSAPVSHHASPQPTHLRALSAEPDTRMVQNPTEGLDALLQSPALIGLKCIQKPSLRTLMAHGGSQFPSRQASPVSEIQSPTLFNQPMTLDDAGVETFLGDVKQQDGWKAERNKKMVGGGIFDFGFDTMMPFSA